MGNDVLIKVEGVSKKFCRSLKRSLWYGVQDVSHELLGRSNPSYHLRSDEFWAVENAKFEVTRGNCLGLIGPNGAGKSTLLKMINGLIKPDRGKITVRGRVGALIELGAGFNPVLTAKENIYVNGAVLGFTKKEIDSRMERIIEFSEIKEFLDTPVQNFSSGMKVRLGFAVASQMEPDILLVDEVLAVGDLGFRMKCFKRILELLERGTAIIVVSHSMIDLRRICEQAIVVNRGSANTIDDLSVAICKYQECMKPLSTKKMGNKSKPHEIHTVSTHNSTGAPAQQFRTGEDVVIKAKVTSKESLIGARLLVSVDSAMGPLGSVSTPYQHFEFDLLPPSTTIQLTLKEIPLLIGSYQVSIGLNGPDRGSALDQVLGAGHFNIVGPATDSFGFGLNHTMKFEHEWKMVD